MNNEMKLCQPKFTLPEEYRDEAERLLERGDEAAGAYATLGVLAALLQF